MDMTIGMTRLCRRWETPRSRFGDFAVLLFLVVQCLDGAFTYLGVSIWGIEVEGNPIVSSAVSVAGLGLGLASAKLFAMGLGIALHLRRVHNVVAVLAAIYVAFAIIPWATMFFLSL
jgi:hypothetical protein